MTLVEVCVHVLLIFKIKIIKFKKKINKKIVVGKLIFYNNVKLYIYKLNHLKSNQLSYLDTRICI